MTRQEIETQVAKSRVNKSSAHKSGICGYMGSLCSGCFKSELEILERFAHENPPKAPMTPLDYWHLIEGPFYDAWYTAASKILKEKNLFILS